MPQISQLQPADDEEQHRPRQLLPHPRSFDEGVKAVVRKARFEPELRRVLQHKPAMQLPPCVAPKA
jgi:hypothetical protein